jgi:peptidyl-prolyl cis-trans isomerase-like protein 2
MVKRQKEKQYQSASENRQNAQLRAGSGKTGETVQRRLPFHCCALTQTAFTNPVCTLTNGVVMDSTALMDFLLAHKKDPISGKPLATSDIVTLHMDQDEEGRWQCPILTKPFKDHTKIVAVLDRSCNEAYVYSFEAYKELNVKAKNWLDLTTSKKFNPKKDVLILNDPGDEEFQKKREIQSFWYIQSGRRASQTNAQSRTDVKHSVTATRIMEQIQKEQAKKRKETSSTLTQSASASSKKLKIYSEDVTGVQYTSGKASGSFTSSAMDVSSETNVTREASQEEILQAQFAVMKKRKEKGYVRMTTNMGDMLLELHCDIAPRTCTNFLGLCQAKKYDGTSFHRLIPGFMLQGGKAKVGEDASLWGPAFQDEFDDRLKHTGSGMLSMANAGPGTNKRQFYITFKSCAHLDRKHSVFGEVVDGKPLLEKIQQLATDKKDRPVEPVSILKMEILVDPAKEAEELEQKRMEELIHTRKETEERKKNMAVGKMGSQKAKVSDGSSSSKSGGGSSMIGKYLPQNTMALEKDETDAGDKGDFPILPPPSKPKAAPIKTKFGNFSGW